MKKLLLGLLLLITVGAKAQTYVFDSVAIYPDQSKPSYVVYALHDTIEYSYKGEERYLRINLSKTEDSVLCRIDSLIEKGPTKSGYIAVYWGREMNQNVLYIVSFLFKGDKLHSIGFNDGDTLTVFIMEKSWAEKNKELIIHHRK